MKKILATVLSLAMIISLIPAAFASGEEGENTSGDLTYVFNAGAYGETEELDLTALGERDDAETFATVNTAKWRLTSQYYLKNIKLTTDAFTWDIKSGHLNNNPAAAFVLETVPGVYEASLVYDPLETGYIAGVYLVPKTDATVVERVEGSAVLSADNKGIRDVLNVKPLCEIGIVDLHEGTQDEIEEKKFGKIVLTENEYYLFIRYNGVNENAFSQVPSRVYAKIHSFNLKKLPDDLDLTVAFTPESITENAVAIPDEGVTVNTYVYTVDGTKKDLDTSVKVPAGTAYEVDADKITGMDGYEFLYWAKGATMEKKQIVSGNEKYSFIPTVEATHLIAVFAPTTASGTAKAEFYNGNGQILPDYTVTSGENVTIPALPSMAGYGDATHWELYGYTTEYKEGDSVALSGSMIFVAQYDELEENITIEVTDGKCDKETYKYGDVVTCTPDDPENFKCWKKNGVIVSIDKEYKFNAWEKCKIEAVSGEYVFTGKATKLLVETFSLGTGTAIMAEFIGLSNYGTVVEKGIMIGDERFAMQKPLATQFTLEAENKTEAKKAVAYAIFANGTMITDK